MDDLKYGDKVEIIKGFYRGLFGYLYEERLDEHADRVYIIEIQKGTIDSVLRICADASEFQVVNA